MPVGKSDKDLLNDLVSRGYGEEERKRRRREQTEELQARREQRTRKKTKARRASTSRSGRPKKPTGPRSPSQSASASEDPQARRMEDALPELSAPLRRRIDAYAYRNRYLSTGYWERLRSLVTIVNPRLGDFASRSLLRLLVGRPRGSTADARTSNLEETLSGLRIESRYLMGMDRAAGSLIQRPQERQVEEQVPLSLRAQEPILLELLPLLAETEPLALRALEFTRLGYRQGAGTDVRKLARITKAVYKLSLSLDPLSPTVVNRLIDQAATTNKAYDSDSIGRKKVDAAAAALKVLIVRLREFRHQLFPVLLKTMVDYFPEQALWEEDNLRKVYGFVGLHESQILSYEAPGDLTRRPAAPDNDALDPTEAAAPDALDDPPDSGDASVDEDTGGSGSFQERFKMILALLRRLFPESGIHRIDNWHFILPYFDLNVFNKDLTFPNQVQQLARTDPMAQIMVLHRIIDNLISSVDTYSLDEVTEVKDDEGLTALSRPWQNIYTDLFDPYLRELADYVRLAESGRMRHTGGARRLFETLGRIRGHAIRGAGRVTSTSTRVHFTADPLYELARRLSQRCGRLKERLNTDLVRDHDTSAVQLLAKITERQVVDLQVNKYKPTIGRLSAYLESRVGSLAEGSKDRAHLAFLEVLYGMAELYDWLLNDPDSFYRGSFEQIPYAGLEERKRWASIRRIAQTEGSVESARAAGQRLDKRATRESWVVAFAEQFDRLAAGREASFVLVEIDGRTTLEDEGAENLIGQTAAMVRRVLADQTAYLSAIGRDRLLVAVPRGGRFAAVWAERWRRTQVERLKQHPLYGEILEQRDTGAKPLGTLSVGVADIEGCVSAEAALRRVEEALQAAAETGNTTIVNHGGTLLLFEDFVARYIKKT